MMRLVPDFTTEGVLPKGDYSLSFDELRNSHLVKGTSERSTWDSVWRAELVDNLEVLVNQLWTVGISEIFIDGSFVEDKDHPNDIDGYFICDLETLSTGELEQKLNALDVHKVWTWSPRSRVTVPGFPKKQLPMWNVYRIELYPHVGQLTGIKDKYGNEQTFPSAFRISRRNSLQKGIIKIERGNNHDTK
jgi:hypothetical protein